MRERARGKKKWRKRFPTPPRAHLTPCGNHPAGSTGDPPVEPVARDGGPHGKQLRLLQKMEFSAEPVVPGSHR